MRLLRLGLVGVTATLLIAALAGTASAARTYDSNFTPFSAINGTALDSDGNVWVTDSGQSNNFPGVQGIYKYNAYPSQTLLEAPNTFAAWGYQTPYLSLAVDHSNDNLFAAMGNGRNVHIFNPNGGLLRSWTGINGILFSNSGGVHVAIDNTQTYSNGRVYLSLAAPENHVEVLDTSQRPVQLSATAPYIEGNAITGTPSGDFGQVQHLNVDHLGDLYVTDTTKNEVYRYASTGEYIRSYPAPLASTGNPTLGGVGIDPTTGDVLITEGSYNTDTEIGGVAEYDSSGSFLGRIKADAFPGGFFAVGVPAVDSSGRLYVGTNGRVDIFDPAPPVPTVEYGQVSDPTTTGGTVHATVGPNGGGPVTSCEVEYGTSTSYGSSLPCDPDPASSPPASSFNSPTAISADLVGLATGQTYHYRVVAENGNGPKYGPDQTYTPQGVVGLRTDPPTTLTEASAQLNGSLVGDGTQTHYRFEWGKTTAYGNTSPAEPGQDAGTPTGPGRTNLPFAVTGLEPFTTYHYRVVATGGSGTSYGEDVAFTTPPGVPVVGAQSVSDVHADRAVMHAEIDAQGGKTTYYFEYVDDASYQDSGFASATKTPPPADGMGMGNVPVPVSASIDGITPGTLYHYRAVAVNSAGTGLPTVVRTFKTYPFGFDDRCPNVHVRQQTGAASLFDCRAYELASATNAGGYDVVSDLVAGQVPFAGYPLAQGPSQLLYGTHRGGIPGTGSPTNHGVDPYVATRGDEGWTTKYVGIPSDNPFAAGPFASTLLEADSGLDTFAFGGPDICSPCFADGSSGLPVRNAGGALVQGMAGSLDPGPGAQPEGFVGRHLSADGSHFVFGSTSQFEPDGNSNGDVTIYDRDLEAGVTEVVSKTPGGATMTGAGIGELDISGDGSRIIIGRLVSTDSAGNRHWHLYMSVGTADQTIDLMPGATSGALYAGMTADGGMVYFTTRDQLTGDDNDSSADIYQATVSTTSAALTRVSVGGGGSGDTDSCDPSANTIFPRWNALGPDPTCDVLAVGGGGGVASGDGTVYFLSPESLDTSQGNNQPLDGAPNLYVARPGEAPRYIRTLESDATAPLPPPAHPVERSIGALGNGVGVAIDRSNGDIYALDIGTQFGAGSVYKFDSEGNASLGFGIDGKLPVAGMYGFYNLPTTLGIDSAPASPNYRNIFVPETSEGRVKAFDPSGGVALSIEGLVFPTAVAIHPTNGNIYVAELFGAGFFGAVSVFDPSGSLITTIPTPTPTSVAVDSSGRAYVTDGGGVNAGEGSVHVYGPTGTDLGQLTGGPAYGVAVDPVTDHVFVGRGDRVSEFDAAHTPVGLPFGAGVISESIGLAANDGTVAVSNHEKGNVVVFGQPVTPTDPRTDNPVVVNSLRDSDTRHTADFQVNPSGDNAVFTSTLPLVDYENHDHREVYRYDEPSGALDCASCNPTQEPASGEATLPPAGLALSDDGRVFFNSTQGLVDRDLNGRQDVYEWKEDEGTELISAGSGPLDSSLLGISSDAVDAFFFTRDVLVKEDENGGRVKIYDARSYGGYPFIPAKVPCKASDECHGPGSQAPSDPNVGTVAGAPVGNTAAKPSRKCRRGKKKRCRGKRSGRHRKRDRAKNDHRSRRND